MIPEFEFDTSIVAFTTGNAHARLGQSPGIRLVNLNGIPAGFDVDTSPDLEVDLDDVRLEATAVGAPATAALLAIGLASVHRRIG